MCIGGLEYKQIALLISKGGEGLPISGTKTVGYLYFYKKKINLSCNDFLPCTVPK